MFSAGNLNNGPLAHVPMTNISVLLQRLEAIAVRAGDVIIREGDEGDYYYLMDSGRAQVTRRVGGVDLPLAELKTGDVFGEEALLSDAKRNATVIMKSNGVLLRLGRQDFLALLKEPLLHKISYEYAIQAVEQGAVWLDVRNPPEYRYDKLRGAMNVPLNEIRNALVCWIAAGNILPTAKAGGAVRLQRSSWRKQDLTCRFLMVGFGRCRGRCSSSLMRKTEEQE